MRNVQRLSLIILAAGLVFRLAPLSAQKPERSNTGGKTLLLEIESAGGRVTYKLETNVVQEVDLLPELGRLVEIRRRDTPVVILVDQDISLGRLLTVKGLALKAGFNTFHIFMIPNSRDSMTKIRIGPAIDYSRNPPLD